MGEANHLSPHEMNEAIGPVDKCAGLMGQFVGADIEEEDAEDVLQPRVFNRPHTTTKAEIEAHEVTHLPYRSWCAHCAAGKGVSAPHCHGDDSENIGITIRLDYCFMGDEASETAPPVLSMWDDGHRALWALLVDNKGAIGYVVTWIVNKLTEAGYSGVDLTLKSDQEPAIMALKKAVALRRQAKTPMIESPVRESQSNGAIERAVRTWKSQFRTLRHQFEGNIGSELDLKHPLTEWMVVWAGDLITRYVPRENGRTAYESMTGHRCKQPVCMFGESAMFRIPLVKHARNKSESDWHTGVFVGIEMRTTESVFPNEHGLFKCRSMKRMPRVKAFHAQCLSDVKHGIEIYVDNDARTAIDHRQGELSADGEIGGRAFVPRRVRLNPEDFIKHGFTGRCRGCVWLQDNIGTRVAHSEECRRRMEDNLQQSACGQERIQRAKDRTDKWVADQVEKGDQDELQEEENLQQVAEDLELEEMDGGNSRIVGCGIRGSTLRRPWTFCQVQPNPC